MIRFFGMFKYIFFIKQYILKLTVNIHASLVGKMFRSGIKGLSAGYNCLCFYARPKFHSSNKLLPGI